jgi:hypothetical protein
VAQEASGNPQGVLYLKLSAHGTALSQMIVSGFGYTRRLLEPCNAAPTGTIAACCNWRSTPRKPSVRRNWPRPFPKTCCTCWISQAQALAGIGLAHGGLYYPEGGWVHPPALCHGAWRIRRFNCSRITMPCNCARSMAVAGLGRRTVARQRAGGGAGRRCRDQALPKCRAAAQAHSRADHAPAANRKARR